MSSQAYVGTAKRTFSQAVLHLLETQYGLLNSRRVLELLASDVQTLAEQFYPKPEHVSSGWMVFTGTKAQGAKARPGQSASDHVLVTLAWPVLTPEDIEALAGFADDSRTSAARRQWMRKRLTRIVDFGCNHAAGPVLLTLADLSVMVNLPTVEVSFLLTEARRETGRPLPTKGHYFDQGMRPTHKDEVIALYEAGVDEAEIARRTQHAQPSVGHYIRDYERVKLLVKHHTSVEDTARLLEIQPGVLHAYLSMIRNYHPELLKQDQAPNPA